MKRNTKRKKTHPLKEKLRRAVRFFSKKNYKLAEKELLEVIKLNPFEEDAYYELYRVYTSTGNVKKAIESLDVLKTISPYRTFPYVELSKLYAKLGNYQKAIEVLEEGVERKDDPKLHFELANLYAKTGQFEEAKEEFSEACRKDFLNVEYRQKFVEFLIDIEDYEEALNVVLSTIELFPKAVYAIQTAGMLCDILGKDELAEYFYRLAVSRADDDFLKDEAKLSLAIFLTDKGMHDQAEEILKELVEETNDPFIAFDAFVELSRILEEQGRFLELAKVGLNLLERNILDKGDWADVMLTVGESLFKERRYTEAVICYWNLVSNCADEKLVKKAYVRLKEIEEIVSLERMLK